MFGPQSFGLSCFTRNFAPCLLHWSLLETSTFVAAIFASVQMRNSQKTLNPSQLLRNYSALPPHPPTTQPMPLEDKSPTENKMFSFKGLKELLSFSKTQRVRFRRQRQFIHVAQKLKVLASEVHKHSQTPQNTPPPKLQHLIRVKPSLKGSPRPDGSEGRRSPGVHNTAPSKKNTKPSGGFARPLFVPLKIEMQIGLEVFILDLLDPSDAKTHSGRETCSGFNHRRPDGPGKKTIVPHVAVALLNVFTFDESSRDL